MRNYLYERKNIKETTVNNVTIVHVSVRRKNDERKNRRDETSNLKEKVFHSETLLPSTGPSSVKGTTYYFSSHPPVFLFSNITLPLHTVFTVLVSSSCVLRSSRHFRRTYVRKYVGRAMDRRRQFPAETWQK